MSVKTVTIAPFGAVKLQKRRGTKNLRLRVGADAKVTVSLPPYVPFRVAIAFAQKHEAWIAKEQAKYATKLHDGQHIGRLHILRFQHDALCLVPKTRVTAYQIIVRSNQPYDSDAAQHAAKKAIDRALKQQAKQFLPKRLKDMATARDYDYNGVTIKQMRGRWGSCNQDKHITLNSYLMELPIELIDYVILHELAHTRALHHGPDFWQEFERHAPNAKALRRQMRGYHPAVPAKVAI